MSKKKKPLPKQHPPKSAPKQPEPTGSKDASSELLASLPISMLKPSDEDRRKLYYDLDRVMACLKKGQQAEAQSRFERAWPDAERTGLSRSARLLWLCSFLPELAEKELRRLQKANDLSLLEQFSVEGVLLFSEEVFAICQRLSIPFVDEAQIIRDAATQIALGDDAAASELLRKISLRSPFRDARLFLRGLMAWYNRRDEEASQAWRALPMLFPYGNFLRPYNDLLYALDNKVNISPKMLAEALPEAVEIRLLAEIDDLQKGQRPNALLRWIEQNKSSFPAPFCEALCYELPGLLQRLGVPSEDIASRMQKVLPALPHDPHFERVEISVAKQPKQIANHILRYIERIQSDGLFPDREMERFALAMLFKSLGFFLLKAKQEEEEDEFDGYRLDDYGLDCDEFDDDDDDDDDDFAGLSSKQRASMFLIDGRKVPMKEAIFAAFTKSLSFHKADQKTWEGYLGAFVAYDDKKGHEHAIEELVKTFPDSPKALSMAASAAKERGSFDKASRYLRRAIELEPLDRTHRTKLVEIGVEKVLKAFHSRDAAKAFSLLDHVEPEANKCSYHPSMRSLRAVMLEALGKKGAAELFAEGPSLEEIVDTVSEAEQWSFWAGVLCFRAWVRETNKKAKWSPVRLRVPPPEGLLTPSEEEMSQMLESYGKLLPDDLQELKAALSTKQRPHKAFWGFLEATLPKVHFVTEQGHESALAWCTEPKIALPIAKQALQLFPNNRTFFARFYAAMLSLQLPPKEFSTFDDDAKQFSYNEGMVEVLMESPLFVAEMFASRGMLVESIIVRVKRYLQSLASNEPTPKSR